MDTGPITSTSPKPADFMWGPKELPKVAPLPPDSPWVKYLQLHFPRENLNALCEHAAHLQSNMSRMLSSEMNRLSKRARATAQKMKDAIMGRD
ncbi:MAG: hypothetical protein JSS10_00660 [Verrucomicrobia bacterium]|nr:hypothetical protein [Verrucomicrobiota bacterium]